MTVQQLLIGGALAGAALLPVAASAASPWLILHPYSGYPQSSVGVEGHGFAPSESVTAQLDSGGTASTTTDGSGNFTTTLVVPQQNAGSYTVNAQGNTGDHASANFYIAGFYPTAQPSSWYVLPNQTLSVNGSNFSPGEQVQISGGPSGTVTVAAGGGNVSASLGTVPFSWQNSTRTITLHGQTSGATVSLNITVGTFYPNLNPSTYYVGKNTGMSASVTGFAPNEQVQLQVNGGTVATQTTDGSGNTSFTFTTPGSGNNFNLTAVGTQSGVSSTRTIWLAQ